MAPWVALPAATVLLAWAYSNAARDTGDAHFWIFWAGVLLFVLPASLRMLSPAASDGERWLLIVALGLFLFVPKYLRDPTLPLFHDELAHWRQVEEIKRSGTLLHRNYTIYVIGEFPGAHLLTAGFSWLTGLSTFRAAQVLLAVLHVGSLIGIATLARVALRSSTRVGAAAALIYALNPSYMFFHSQFAYESVTIVLLIWVLVAVAKICETGGSARWFSIGLLLSASCTVTHHLTTYVLLAILLVSFGFTVIQHRVGYVTRAALLQVAGLSVVLGLAATAWIVLVAHDALSYLEPNIVGGVNGLTGLINHGDDNRAPFAGSPLPIGERVLGLASVPLTAAVIVLGVRALRQSAFLPKAPVMYLTSWVLAAGYFVSLPFLLSGGGAESAHRSWGYSFIGIAVTGAPGVVDAATSIYERASRRRVVMAVALVAALVTALVGNVANGMNEAYRFPGPYIWGSDTRSLSPELLAMTNRFEAIYGRDQKVVADRYSALALASFGDEKTASPSAGFRLWELYFGRGPSKQLLSQLATGGWRFVVVDRRMPRVTPLRGFYIYNLERNYVGDARPSPYALRQFDVVPWARRVLQTTNYSVYELNRRALLEAAR